MLHKNNELWNQRKNDCINYIERYHKAPSEDDDKYSRIGMWYHSQLYLYRKDALDEFRKNNFIQVQKRLKELLE